MTPTHQASDDSTDELLDAAAIDRAFRPMARDDLAEVALDGETVIFDPVSGESHLLNPVGSVIWSCFDGSGTIDELANDLATEFGIEAETAAADVTHLAQILGHKGLLTGVRRFVPQPPPPVVELEVGTAVESFTVPTVGAGSLSLADLRGKRAVLVNWGTRCGYCDRVVPELVAAEPGLAERDVALVLLSSGTDEDHQKLLDAGLGVPIGLVGQDGPHLFTGVGTPAAYVLDEAGAVASPLIVGAVEVPKVVRELAGQLVEAEPSHDHEAHDHDHDHHDHDHDGYDESEEEDEDGDVADGA